MPPKGTESPAKAKVPKATPAKRESRVRKSDAKPAPVGETPDEAPDETSADQAEEERVVDQLAFEYEFTDPLAAPLRKQWRTNAAKNKMGYVAFTADKLTKKVGKAFANKMPGDVGKVLAEYEARQATKKAEQVEKPTIEETATGKDGIDRLAVASANTDTHEKIATAKPTSEIATVAKAPITKDPTPKAPTERGKTLPVETDDAHEINATEPEDGTLVEAVDDTTRAVDVTVQDNGLDGSTLINNGADNGRRDYQGDSNNRDRTTPVEGSDETGKKNSKGRPGLRPASKRKTPLLADEDDEECPSKRVKYFYPAQANTTITNSDNTRPIQQNEMSYEWNDEHRNAFERPKSWWGPKDTPGGKGRVRRGSAFPPENILELLYTNPARDARECEGRWCWGRKSVPGCTDPNCGHTLKEWLQGGEDWQERFEIRNSEMLAIGFGLFSRCEWKINDILGCYLGEIKPRVEPNASYFVKLQIGPEEVVDRRKSAAAKSVDKPKFVYVDAERRGNWARFMNHNCNNNAEIVQARVGSTKFIAIRARRKIVKGEQVTIDYGNEYFTERNPCRCGEDVCKYANGKPAKRKKRGSDSGEDPDVDAEPSPDDDTSEPTGEEKMDATKTDTLAAKGKKTAKSKKGTKKVGPEVVDDMPGTSVKEIEVAKAVRGKNAKKKAPLKAPKSAEMKPPPKPSGNRVTEGRVLKPISPTRKQPARKKEKPRRTL